MIRTARLTLRRPTDDDLEAIFAYASDAEVVRYMSWPRHPTRDASRGFMIHQAREWAQYGSGTYLITLGGGVIGSTGLHLDDDRQAATGYLLARSHWGHGYATEACRAMVELARARGLRRLEAHCHVDHAASARVLTKAGLPHEATLPAHLVFPNLSPALLDVHLHAIDF